MGCPVPFRPCLEAAGLLRKEICWSVSVSGSLGQGSGAGLTFSRSGCVGVLILSLW